VFSVKDCVLILNHRPLEKVSATEIKVGKNEHQLFVMDSYDSYAKKMMVENGFLNMLLDFATQHKDNINEETMELLEPYLAVSDFHPERAKTVSSAAEGLWYETKRNDTCSPPRATQRKSTAWWIRSGVPARLWLIPFFVPCLSVCHLCLCSPANG